MQDEYVNDRHVVRRTMWWVAGVRLLRGSWMLVLVALGTSACRNNAPTPSIAFTRIPPAAKGARRVTP
jgi:hypothetical protein